MASKYAGCDNISQVMAKIKEENYKEFAKKTGAEIKPEEATKFRRTAEQI